MFTLTLLAAVLLSVPDEPLARQLRAAIWDDLQRNAMIGNGNRLVAPWYVEGEEESRPPRLSIEALDCIELRAGHRCSFTLWREDAPQRVLG